MPIGDQEKFEVDKAKLGPLAAALKSECASALKSAKSAEDAGHGIAAAVQKYVDGAIALIEKEVEEQGFQKATTVGGAGGGPGGI